MALDSHPQQPSAGAAMNLSASNALSVPHQPVQAWRWDAPWAWTLGQQVAALGTGVGVALAACIASLWPTWQSITALQQAHEVLLAQQQAGEQMRQALPELQQQVQTMRVAQAQHKPTQASNPAAWALPVTWSPLTGAAGSAVSARWRAVAQGPSLAVTHLMAQLSQEATPLQVELLRLDHMGPWQLRWEVAAQAPPLAPKPVSTHRIDGGALLDEQALLVHWHEQLSRQPGRQQWLAPELKRTREALEAFDLHQIEWVGWLQQGNQRMAVVQAGNTLHRVAVGAHVGRQHGRVQHIGDDHLVLRQIQRNAQGHWEPHFLHWPTPKVALVSNHTTPLSPKARP
ncbi:MAG: hypothetical protein EBQ82_07945 [Betaproteobacteria bacterium]|nr:hypothetical protein [Betaproteobacteria bacterium]NBY05304.1 hypothetical protein [Betaproteobacteria bacterium]